MITLLYLLSVAPALVTDAAADPWDQVPGNCSNYDDDYRHVVFKSDAGSSAAVQILLIFGCMFLCFCCYIAVFVVNDATKGNTTVVPTNNQSSTRETEAHREPDGDLQRASKSPREPKTAGTNGTLLKGLEKEEQTVGDCVLIPTEAPDIPPPPLPSADLRTSADAVEEDGKLLSRRTPRISAELMATVVQARVRLKSALPSTPPETPPGVTPREAPPDPD